VSRALYGIHIGGGAYYDRRVGSVIFRYGSRRIYTNGHVLISEMDRLPKRHKLVDIDSLWEISKDEKFEFPTVATDKMIGDAPVSIANAVFIPEEFYQYAQAFTKPKPKQGQVRVQVRVDEIAIVTDHRDESGMECTIGSSVHR